jgi:hypothetical protein
MKRAFITVMLASILSIVSIYAFNTSAAEDPEVAVEDIEFVGLHAAIMRHAAEARASMEFDGDWNAGL